MLVFSPNAIAIFELFASSRCIKRLIIFFFHKCMPDGKKNMITTSKKSGIAIQMMNGLLYVAKLFVLHTQ